MGDESDEEMFFHTPPDIAEAARDVSNNLLPEKSKLIYEKRYNQFAEWCTRKKIANVSENVLLAYFSDELKHLQGSSLWAIYSMLKSTLRTRKNIDISQYYKLIAFLKKKSSGHCPKKSKTLDLVQIKSFVTDAPDATYLMKKVALIFGIFGACRGGELVQMQVSNVEDHETMLYVKIVNSKNNLPRSFTISNVDGMEFIEIVRKYLKLRPTNCTTDRLFIKYVNGKCHNQPVGKNTFAKIPFDIASFLKLPDPQSFTGHCFRRSSATLLASSGCDILELKRLGGWKSSTVAEGYIDDSIPNKMSTSRKLFNVQPTSSSSTSKEKPSTSASNELHGSNNDIVSVAQDFDGHQEMEVSSQNNKSLETNLTIHEKNSSAGSGIQIKNCTNCSFIFNYSKN